MFREILRKEFVQNLLTTRFFTCLVLSLLLIVIGALVGRREFGERLAEYDAVRAGEQEELSEVRVYSHVRPVVARRPSPLLLFNRGYAERVGATVRITHTDVPWRASGGGLQNEFLALFPTFDLVDVARYVLGLLALLLAFDAVSGERESGTLRLVLSNPVSRGRLALAKYLGGVVTLLVPLAIGFLVALLFLNVGAPVRLAGDEWVRALLIVLAAALYLSVMLLAGLLLSALCRRSSTALMLSMLVWLMVVVVVPNLSIFLASEAIEIESSRALRLREDALREETEAMIAAFEEALPPSGVMGELSIYGTDEEVLVRLGRPERYAWLARYYAYRNAAWLRHADRVWNTRREHDFQRSRQANLARGVSCLSPAWLVDGVTQSLAGSSLRDHEDFMEAARRYRGDLVDYIESRGGYRSRAWFTDDPPEQEPLVLDLATFDRNHMDMERAWALLDAARADRSRILDLGDMPGFREHPARLADRVRRCSGEIALLLGLNVALFGLFFLAFQRYDAR